jgi:hypothetical protein
MDIFAAMLSLYWKFFKIGKIFETTGRSLVDPQVR